MLEEVSDVISFFFFKKYPVLCFTSTKVQILTQMLEQVWETQEELTDTTLELGECE
jgi:hypothetical protein